MAKQIGAKQLKTIGKKLQTTEPKSVLTNSFQVFSDLNYRDPMMGITDVFTSDIRYITDSGFQGNDYKWSLQLVEGIGVINPSPDVTDTASLFVTLNEGVPRRYYTVVPGEGFQNETYPDSLTTIGRRYDRKSALVRSITPLDKEIEPRNWTENLVEVQANRLRVWTNTSFTKEIEKLFV